MLKTLVVHHHSGIGDLVWHVPYFRAIAATSANGKVTVMARPSCKAADLLSGEHCVENVIEFDHRPRDKTKKGKHDSIASQLELCRELKKRNFDRIIIFSGRVRYAILAAIAGIPSRSGYGFTATQRLFLNHPPYIQRFNEQGSWVYPEATDFALAQGFVKEALVPKLSLPDELVQAARMQLAHLRQPRIAFAIGASAAAKNWGIQKFADLANRLAHSGASVLILGGPSEKDAAEQGFSSASISNMGQVSIMCQASVLKSAAALKTCDFCIGNDTGMLNVAAAIDVPALGLFGKTRPLMHDPLLHAISANGMADISVEDVLNRLSELNLNIAVKNDLVVNR